MKKFLAIAASGLWFFHPAFAADALTNRPAEFPVTYPRRRRRSQRGELTPSWRFFGYDEANYTYMKDGKKLLGRTRPT